METAINLLDLLHWMWKQMPRPSFGYETDPQSDPHYEQFVKWREWVTPFEVDLTDLFLDNDIDLEMSWQLMDAHYLASIWEA